MKLDDIFKGRVTAYTFGAEGIVRIDGKVVFVPFTIVGEEIEFSIIDVKKSYARGKLLRVISSSPERQTPFCKVFGRCGGCQLQHMSQKEQLRYKKESASSALRKICPNIEATIENCPPDRAWRQKITLHLEPETCRLFYRGVDPNEKVFISYCPIFVDDPKTTQFREIEEAYLKLAPHKRKERITLYKDNPSSHEATRTIGDISFLYDPRRFIQNHVQMSEIIYSATLNLVLELGAKKVLDLYSGCGILSQMLIHNGVEVVSCEADSLAVAIAKKSLQKNVNPTKQANKSLFMSGTIEEKRGPLKKNGPYDLVIVNPPRSGLSEEVRNWLLEISPKTVIYISCMPPTLARDLEPFCRKGYQATAIRVFDLFPQTSHMETVVVLKHKD